MGSVVLAGATSGSTTITPSDTVTVTVTLPSTGGTLQTSGAGFTTNGVAYASSTSALTTGSSLVWTGSALGIGTSSPAAILHVSTSAAEIGRFNSSSVNGGYLSFQTSGTTFGYFGAGATLGGGSATDMGFRSQNNLTFMTGGGNEAMRIDTSQNLLVGTTSNSRGARLRVEGQETAYFTGYGNSYGIGLWMTPNPSATGGTATAISLQNVSNTTVGTIATTASATAYNTSSDYRLKESIAPMTGALAKVSLLKPCTYKWKSDGTDGQGFIAHELAEVVAGCVTGEKDAVDANGKPVYQGIDTSFLVATLTAAIQELSTLITAQSATIQSLTARLTALENK